MAFKLAELFVAVRADTTRFTAAMAGMQGVVTGMKTQLRQLATLARNVFLVGAGIIAALTGAAASYEKSMARIRGITRMTQEQFVKFDKVVRDLGLSTIYSAKEVADAAKYLAVSGFSVEEIMGALPHVMDLAAAGVMEVSEAADYAAKTMRGLGISSDKLGDAVDMLTKGFTSANTDLRQFAEALSYVGPVARFSSYSLNEVGAAIMVVSNAGIQAERAGTGLRRFLAELSRQASPTRDAFEKLGITLMNNVGRLRPLPSLIGDLDKALKRTTPEAQRLGKLMDIFGLRAGPAVAAMLRVGEVGLDRYQEMLRMAGGTAAYVAKVQIETLYGRLRQLKNAIFETAIGLGLVLKPAVEAIVGALRKFHLWLRELSPASKQAIAAVLFLTTAVSGLRWALLTVGSALYFIAANPLIALLVGLEALAMGIWYASAKGETFGEKLSSMWGDVLAAWRYFEQNFLPALTSLWNTISNWISWLMSAVPGAWRAVVEFVEPIINGFRVMVAQVWELIGGDVSTMMDWITGRVVGAWTWVAKNIGPIMDWMRGAILKSFAAISFAIKEWELLLKYVLFSAVYHLTKFGNQVAYLFMTVIPAYLKWFAENWQDIFRSILSFNNITFTNMATNVKNFFTSVWDYMKGKDWKFAWTPITEGFKSTIKEWPKIADREIGTLEKRLGKLVDDTGKKIGKKWDKHFEDFVGRAFESKVEEEDIMPVPKMIDDPKVKKELGKKGKDFGKFAGDVFAQALKNAPVFIGLEEMSRRLQKAALKEDNVQARQLAELKKINENLKKWEKPVHDPVVGP